MIGVISPVLSPDQPISALHVEGSELGARECVRNLIRYSREDVAILVPDVAAPSAFRDLGRIVANHGRGSGNGKLIPYSNIPVAIGSGHLRLIHNVQNPTLHAGCYLRQRFAPAALPVTCLVHGLSLQRLRWEFIAHLLAAPALDCDAVVCTSHTARQAMERLLWSVREGMCAAGVEVPETRFRLEVVPLGVDTDRFRPRELADTRRCLGLPLDKTILLYFGRVDHATKSDMGPLLFALRHLVERYGNHICLVIAGNIASPAATAHLEATAEELGCREHLILRQLPPPEVAPLYYSAADIFVSLPDTLQESFGLSPLEAMASGLCCVVADWDGYRETVAHGETGYRIRTLWADCVQELSDFSPIENWIDDHARLAQTVVIDMDELISRLDQLVGNASLRQKMGEAARRRATLLYDWRCVLDRLRSLWEELTEVAANTEMPSFSAANIERAQYFEVFGHYATQILAPGDHIALTDRGLQACRMPYSLALPLGVGGLNQEILVTLLRMTRLLKLMRVKPEIGSICERIAARRRRSTEYVMRHAIWLLKYGYLRVETSITSPLV